jgi:hypothetical protein
MVRTIFTSPKVVDCVQSTCDLDQFTCTFRGIESEVDRELLGYSARFVGGGLRLRGLRQQRQRQQPTSECQRRNQGYYPPVVRYDHHIHSFP